MSTQHEQNSDIQPRPGRSARCLRHHVWMAYCGDCRDAHTSRIRSERETDPAER